MATYNVKRAKHATTTADVVDEVVLEYVASGFDIINLGPYPLYITLDGTDPTVAGDDLDIVPAGAVSSYPDADRNLPSIKLISGGVTAYSVVSHK